MAEVIKTILDVDINTGNSAAQLKALQTQANSFFLTLNKGNQAASAASKTFASDLFNSINSSRVFTAEVVKMRTAAGALDDTLRKGQATLGQYFSARYMRNSALFAETLDLARNKASILQTQFVATSAASKGFQDALAIRPLSAFSSEAVIASQRTQILSQMFRQGTTQLINFGKNVQWAGRQLMVGFTIPLTIFGNAAGRTFMELERQAVSFKKVYGDIFTPPEEMEANFKAVQDLSNEFTKYGIAASNTLDLAAQAAAAGRRNAELTDAVTQATRLATLGQMDQNQALETTIALQSAFRLSGEDLANSINFLNMVENQTVVSLQDLAAAIPRVAPVIKGLGGDVKDLSVFLAAMQEGGVSAEQGANALKSGLASLINPTNRAKDVLAGFNINLDAIVAQNRGDLMGTVMAFGRALQQLDEFSRQQALEEVFGKFQYARLGALFENIVRDGSQASQVLDTMTYSTEELAATAEKELSVIEESFAVQLTGAVEKFKLAIAPIGEIFVKLAIPVINFLTGIIEKFNELPDFQKNFLAFAAVITGLVIPAGTMFFGLLMNLVGTLAKLFQFMGAFGKGFLRGGIIGALQNATQSTRFLSNAEMEAALAAKQLGSATEVANAALRRQITQAMSTGGAVRYLADSYNILTTSMLNAAKTAPFTLGSGETAILSQRTRRGRNIQRRNKGGRILGFNDGNIVPGTGNRDTVPAALTPGEFVVNKEATSRNLDLLRAINSGDITMLSKGGKGRKKNKYKGPRSSIETTQKEYEILTGKTKSKAKETTKPKKQSAKPSQSTGRVFAHMQPNLDIKNSVFNDMYNQFGKGDVRPLSPRQQAMWDIGKATNWSGWRFLGNLGFTLSGATNSALNTVKGGSGILPRDLINELNTNKNTAYDKMLRSLGVSGNQKGIISSTIHSAVIKELSALDPTKRIKDSDLYKIMPKTVTNALIKAGLNENAINKLNNVRELRTGAVTPGRTYGDWKVDFEDPVNKKGNLVATNSKTGVAVKIQKQGSKEGMARRVQKMTGLALLRRRYGFNKGGKVFRLNKGNTVPGSGNQDTVPAMLTPGEFVVNKESAQENFDLLNAINSGRGYRKGGMARMQNGGPATLSPEIKKIMKEAAAKGTILTSAEAAAYRDQGITGGAIRSGAANVTPAQQPSRMSRFGGAASAAGMAALFAPALISEPLANSTNDMAKGIGEFIQKMTPIIMGFGIIAPMLPGIIGALGAFAAPVLAVVGGLIAIGAAMKKARENVDNMARESAKAGAAFGGTANALDTMAGVLGKQTPLQMQLSQQIPLTAKQLQAQEETIAALQTEQGQALVERFKGISSAERIDELTSYLQNAIAAGLMDSTSAREFARVMASTLGDTMLAPAVIRTINQQQTGSSAMLELAQRRAGGFREQATATPAMRGGQIGGEQALESAAFNIGVATQVYKDAAQTQAIARQELEKGIITQREFNETLKATNDLQAQSVNAVRAAVESGADAGGIAQALKDQFILGGGTKEQLEVLEENIKNIGTALSDAGLSADTTSQLSADLQLKVMSGEINPADLPTILETIKANPSFTVNALLNASVTGEEGAIAILTAWAQNNLQGLEQGQFSVLAGMDVEAAREAQGIFNALQGTEAGGSFTQRFNQLMTSLVDPVPQINQLISAFKTLNTLPDTFDKGIILKSATVDGNLDLEKMKELVNQFNEGYKNLESTNPEVVKSAILDISTAMGSKDPAGVLAFINQEIKNFNDLTLEDKYASVEVATKVNAIDAQIAALAASIGDDREANMFIYRKISELKGQRIEAMSGLPTAAGATTTQDQGEKELSNLEKFQQSYKETMTAAKQYYEAIRLGKNGIDTEGASLLAVNGLLDVNARQRKKVVEQIKRQQAVQAAMSYLQQSQMERDIDRLELEKANIQRSIDADEERLRAIQRQNELDQRQVSLRQRGIELLSRKEEQVNKAYDTRINALNLVAQLNDRLAQQNQDRINLASALTTGDIAAAAQAANQMQANFAQGQIEDTQAAMEAQRERDLASLTVQVNGQYFNRAQLEAQILSIEDQIYNRSLQMLPIQDQIFNKTESIRSKNEEINALQIKIKEKEMEMVSEGLKIIAAFGEKGKKAKAFKDQVKGAYDTAINLNKELGKPINKIVTITTVGGGKTPGRFGGLFRMGGKVGKYAMGGMVNYKGSNESPPPLKMAMGNIVPGMANVDRVPALLTPGEFVVNRESTKAYLPYLKAMNDQVFPSMSDMNPNVFKDIGPMPTVDTGSITNATSSSVVNTSPTVYNDYTVNVNVPNTDASPDQIANVVMAKIQRTMGRNVRGVRI
ncbi:MAG: phage tail tape measure protein [Sediminibacterium sp.]